MKHLKLFEGKSDRASKLKKIELHVKEGGGAVMFHELTTMKGGDLTLVLEKDGLHASIRNGHKSVPMESISDATLDEILEIIAEDETARKNAPTNIQSDVSNLRGLIGGQAEKNPLPSRFKIDASKSPKIVIEDTSTGRKSEVPLFAYGNVRKTLNDFFGK